MKKDVVILHQKEQKYLISDFQNGAKTLSFSPLEPKKILWLMTSSLCVSDCQPQKSSKLDFPVDKKDLKKSNILQAG